MLGCARLYWPVIYGCYLSVLRVNSTRIDLETNERCLSGPKNTFSLIQPQMSRHNC